jgi:hypothetical protein
LFSRDGRSVPLDDLSIDQFNVLSKKMSNAGIHPKLDISPKDPNIPVCVKMPDDNVHPNLKLEQYNFFIHSVTLTYTINFTVIHKSLVNQHALSDINTSFM